MTDVTEAEILDQKVTASLSTEVSFNPQVADADAAIKNRQEATKNARAAWLAVVNCLAAYNVKLSRRRGTVDAAYDAIKNIRVFKPTGFTEEEVDALEEAYNQSRVLGDNYHVNQLLVGDQEPMELLEAQFPGFESFIRDAISAQKAAYKAYQKANKSPQQDKKATADAQAAATLLADAFAQAMEQVEDTAEVLTGVREYIGVVESIANISAVANKGKEQ